jgi:hypothetical protein
VKKSENTAVGIRHADHLAPSILKVGTNYIHFNTVPTKKRIFKLAFNKHHSVFHVMVNGLVAVCFLVVGFDLNIPVIININTKPTPLAIVRRRKGRKLTCHGIHAFYPTGLV